MSGVDYRECLVEFLIEEGLSASVVWRLLESIAAPESLIAFGKVVSTLEQILPVLNDIDPDVWSVEEIAQYQNVLLTCRKLDGKLVKKIPSYEIRGRGKSRGLHGILSKFPLYSALCFYKDSVTDSRRYYLLQAQYLNACLHFMQLEGEEKIYTSRRQVISLLIRRIASEPLYINTLKLLPDSPLKMDEFYEWLCEKRKNELPEIDRLNLHEIELLLIYALGQKNVIRRSRAQGIRLETRNQLVMDEPLDAEDSFDSPARRTVLTSGQDSDCGNELHLLGCARAERLTGPKMVVDQVILNLDRSVTPSIQAYRTHNRNRSIAMNNQSLPMSWERLNPHDVSCLFQGARGLLAGSLDIGLEHDECQMLVAVIAVMFWTSSTLERTLGARVSRSVDDLPKKFVNSELFYCIKERVWAVQLPELEQRKIADISWQFQLRQSRSFILLPVGNRVYKTLHPLISKIAVGIRSRSRPFFDEKNDKIEDLLRVFLRQTNLKYNARLTILRITRHLFKTIADKSGDVGDAAIITGRQPNFGQATSLYYYAPDSRRMQEIYASVCGGIVKVVYESLGKRLVQNEPTEFPDGNFVGSQICPTEHTVLLFVEDLRAKIEHARGDFGNPDYLVNFHNAFTSYCVSLLGFTTGYRAVRDPLCSELDINWQLGCMIICDKDDDNYHNTRLIWCPEVLLQQLRSFKQHRSAMAERLILQRSEVGLALLEKEDGRSSELPFLFYLRRNGKSCRVSPYEISQEIDWCNTLPLNSNRHYLHTKLREKNTCGEVVDAFLGHWDTGQEPHGRYSSLSPIAVKKHVEQPLTELLNDAGWRVIEGLS